MSLFQSLESNFESLESVCETSAEEISLIAAKCGASEAEIDTFFAGIALLKAALDGKFKQGIIEKIVFNFGRFIIQFNYFRVEKVFT